MIQKNKNEQLDNYEMHFIIYMGFISLLLGTGV